MTSAYASRTYQPAKPPSGRSPGARFLGYGGRRGPEIQIRFSTVSGSSSTVWPRTLTPQPPGPNSSYSSRKCRMAKSQEAPKHGLPSQELHQSSQGGRAKFPLGHMALVMVSPSPQQLPPHSAPTALTGRASSAQVIAEATCTRVSPTLENVWLPPLPLLSCPPHGLCLLAALPLNCQHHTTCFCVLLPMVHTAWKINSL